MSDMDTESVFETIKEIIRQVVPTLRSTKIEPQDTFKMHCINSIEKMEVNMLLLEEVELDIPRVQLLKAETFGELAKMVSQKLMP